MTENEKAEDVVEVGLSDFAVEEPKLKEDASPVGADMVVTVDEPAVEPVPNEKALGSSLVGSFSFSTPIVLSGVAS